MLQFTDTERERIKQTVQQAERGTKGEIVPMIVARLSAVPRSGLSHGTHSGSAYAHHAADSGDVLAPGDGMQASRLAACLRW